MKGNARKSIQSAKCGQSGGPEACMPLPPGTKPRKTATKRIACNPYRDEGSKSLSEGKIPYALSYDMVARKKRKHVLRLPEFYSQDQMLEGTYQNGSWHNDGYIPYQAPPLQPVYTGRKRKRTATQAQCITNYNENMVEGVMAGRVNQTADELQKQIRDLKCEMRDHYEVADLIFQMFVNMKERKDQLIKRIQHIKKQYQQVVKLNDYLLGENYKLHLMNSKLKSEEVFLQKCQKSEIFATSSISCKITPSIESTANSYSGYLKEPPALIIANEVSQDELEHVEAIIQTQTCSSPNIFPSC